MTDAELDQCRHDGALLRSIVSRTVKLKPEGREWKGLCPFHTEKTPSFTVFPDGRYHCFGCNADGTSFDFIMKSECCDFSVAVNRVAAEKGIASAKKVDGNGTRTGEMWQPLVPPPADAPKPTDRQLGCDMLHEYPGTNDHLLCFVRRIEPKNGKRKQFYPLTYGVLNGKRGWHDRAPDPPRPLYGLNRLSHAAPDAVVLLCEGEKAADAAQRLFPNMVAMSWMGGANADRDADFSPLAGRDAILWPDADQPGRDVMARIAKRLPLVRGIVDTEVLPDGFDAADLEHDGVDDPDAWLDARLRKLEPLPDEANASDVQLVSPPITPVSQIPPRQWAYGRFLLFGAAAVIGAMDGAGKGLIAVAIALAFITGIPLLGETIWRTGPVAILSYEDDIDEWRRRFAAACIQHGLDFETVMPSVQFLTKRDGRVVLAQRTSNSLVFPDSARIIHLIRSAGIALLIVDPFNNAHAMEDGNNNVAVAAVAQEVSHIARAANVAALVLHHLRKGAAGSVDDLMGAVALRANFRSCRILAQMTAEEGEQLSITELWRYLRVSGTKENYVPPPDKAMWFQKASLRLENPAGIYSLGDEVGAVVRWTPPTPFEGGLGYAELHAVFDALRAPHSPTKQSRAIPWAGMPLMDLAGRTEAQATRILGQWLKAGVLARGTPVQTAHRHKAQTVTQDPIKVAAILTAIAPGQAPPNE